MKRVLLMLVVFGGVVASLPLLWRVWLTWSYADQTFDAPDMVPVKSVALVFGAAVVRDRPSAVLADRIEAAAALYHNGKVQKLLMSGDHSRPNYNEPAVMARYAQRLGVPEADIILDEAGHRTYDTCYRARTVFQVEQAVLVTQAFHLPRAQYLCEQFGLTVVGLAADRRQYREASARWWEVRETLATSLAWWDVTVARPDPVPGEPLPIQFD